MSEFEYNCSNRSDQSLETAIETIDLKKTFSLGTVNVEVLKNVKVEIHKGDFVSVMGPSGSGKSTLLYLIGGLDKPTSGSIMVAGRDIAVMDDREISILRRRTIGFVFQFYNLVPNLNVEENILLPVLLDGKKAKDCKARLDELLENVGLTGRRLHTPREMSGGEQQRVSIARALVNNPDIILADEPTGNLDTKTGREIMRLLKEINLSYEKTIVMVTHSPESAEYGNRIINIRDGEVVEA
jgi:putative ABC transport system ATP-binding protein